MHRRALAEIVLHQPRHLDIDPADRLARHEMEMHRLGHLVGDPCAGRHEARIELHRGRRDGDVHRLGIVGPARQGELAALAEGRYGMPSDGSTSSFSLKQAGSPNSPPRPRRSPCPANGWSPDGRAPSPAPARCACWPGTSSAHACRRSACRARARPWRGRCADEVELLVERRPRESR